MPNQTFKEFTQELINDNKRKIILAIFLFISAGFALIVWHSLETGIVRVLCRATLCTKIALSEEKGEFYAWVVVYGVISISSFIYWLYLLVNKTPNNSIKADG